MSTVYIHFGVASRRMQEPEICVEAGSKFYLIACGNAPQSTCIFSCWCSNCSLNLFFYILSPRFLSCVLYSDARHNGRRARCCLEQVRGSYGSHE